MTGINQDRKVTLVRRRGIVLTDRDRNLMRELAVLRLIDRDLARQVGKFGSTTRVNERLLKLNRAGFLNRFFVGTISGGRRAIYTLTRKAGALLGVSYQPISRSYGNTVVGDLFVRHQERVNEFYVALKYSTLPQAYRLLRWLALSRPITPNGHLIPDGYFEIETPEGVRAVFLEIDLGTESMRVWAKKATEYLTLARSGEFTEMFHHSQFRVLVITTTERRLAHIRSVIAKQTTKIFWLSDFSIIHREGIWSPVWHRPTGDERLPLF